MFIKKKTKKNKKTEKKYNETNAKKTTITA